MEMYCVVGNLKICSRKGTISRIFQIFVYNLESIAATDLDFGITILSSSHYTSKEFRALAFLVWAGRVRTSIASKSLFYALFWQLSAQDRRLVLASNVESVK